MVSATSNDNTFSRLRLVLAYDSVTKTPLPDRVQFGVAIEPGNHAYFVPSVEIRLESVSKLNWLGREENTTDSRCFDNSKSLLVPGQISFVGQSFDNPMIQARMKESIKTPQNMTNVSTGSEKQY